MKKPNKTGTSISPCRLLRCLVVLVGILLSLSTNANESCYLNIHGVTSVFDQSYSVDKIGKVTFAEDVLSVHFTDTPAFYEIMYDDLLKITFGERKYTDVHSVSATRLSIVYASATATAVIESNHSIAQVALYNLQGVMLQYVAPHTLNATLDLSGYPAGIYIIRATSGDKTQTHKIIK